MRRLCAILLLLALPLYGDWLSEGKVLLIMPGYVAPVPLAMLVDADGKIVVDAGGAILMVPMN